MWFPASPGQGLVTEHGVRLLPHGQRVTSLGQDQPHRLISLLVSGQFVVNGELSTLGSQSLARLGFSIASFELGMVGA